MNEIKTEKSVKTNVVKLVLDHHNIKLPKLEDGYYYFVDIYLDLDIYKNDFHYFRLLTVDELCESKKYLEEKIDERTSSIQDPK